MKKLALKFGVIATVFLALSAQTSMSAPFSEAARNRTASPLSLAPENTANTFLDQNIFAELNTQPAYQAGDTTFFLCNIGAYDFGSGFGGTDCWGWRDSNGTDYAIMGTLGGISFFNATTFEFIQTVPGPGPCGATWRDMATYQNYCYAVSECGDATDRGMMVMDMQYLPDSVKLLGRFLVNNTANWWSHNLAIDTVKGFLYIEGNFTSNSGFSVFVHDLADPSSPAFVGSFGPAFGIHDIYAMNDTVYLAEGGSSSFSIWDMANKSLPTLITRWTSPTGGLAHNIWPTDDRTHVVTTEETIGKTVKIWDIQDLNNIQIVGEYLAPAGLAHNAHVENDTLYLSHYESGVAIVDITDPTNPTEIALFDTWVTENPGFNGCWGIFPHTGSDLVYAANTDNVLLIFSKQHAVLGDTMVVEHALGGAGNSVRVRVSATNSMLAPSYTVPFGWTGPMNLTFDSVSIAGTRADGFEVVDNVAFDPFGKRAAYQIIASTSNPRVGLEPGTGPILDLFFTIPGSPGDTTNPIVLTSFSGVSPVFGTQCQIVLNAEISQGSLTLFTCCDLAGDVDDVGDVNVGDASYIVNYIFLGGATPPCCDQADADGGGDVNIGDASYILKYIFHDGALPQCPIPSDLTCL
ncbi:MAG: choice-of-anchor B family protein [candidate division Zixibacteria bacterium]|nr:choice-of-anchor B family protein [candidate division Zixibacteria bacterium]